MKEYDYEVRRGETFEGCFWVIDTDDQPIKLLEQGFKIKGEIRPTKEDTIKTATFSCAIDDTGCVQYVLPASITKTIEPGLYEYDIALYQDYPTERVVKYYIGGKFHVKKAVTNALVD